MPRLKYVRAGFVEPARPIREAALKWVALWLRSTSAALARWSRRIAQPAPRPSSALPELEFYAEAGAPEGALYLNGLLIGQVRGVRRL